MISYTCDNCGFVAPSQSGAVPDGWFSLTTTVQKPVDPSSETPMPPATEVFLRHADKQECYDAIVAGTHPPATK